MASDPHLARRAVDTKWLTALLSLATVAILMLGAVGVSLHSGLSVAMAPVFRHATTASNLQRADRLPPVKVSREGDVIRSRIEQLADDGHGTTPFTHVMVRLARASGDPRARETSVNKGTAEATISAAAVPVAPDRASIAVAASAAGETLPPEIRFGTSQLAPSAQASAFVSEAAPDSFALPGEPINLTVIAKAAGAIGTERRIIVARSGDTLDGMLTALGVTVQDAGAITKLLKPHSWFGRAAFAGGEVVTVLQDRAQDPAQDRARPQQVSLAREGKPERAAALSDNGTYVAVAPQPDAAAVAPNAAKDDVALDRSAPGVKLRESLDRLAQDNRVPPSLVDDIVRLCGRDVDLEAMTSALDTAELLYSPNAEGEPELAFAALTLDGHHHRYYRFTAPDDGGIDYYDADGHSVTASLIHKPVANGRLGDGFGWRVHPILQDRRFHEGVDYAAPFGSPIAAAGAGVVEKIDQEAGYGKYVRIRHDFGYETTYAHISGMPRGLKVGTRIRRGQTIGYVGSTGLSTGPHLYYELRVNGHYADPLLTHLPAGRVLDGDALTAFQQARTGTDLLLQASARSAGSSR
ncbi:M23 family metallopeptidase [Bradyrhizobium sp. S69]|uniref:M23 family metallopeptidase n=1 Tax=Bradyrhizobium sp. S69 TaxID=1641856 RepID=UPI00131E6CDD|nr:M23 family metallopeptidase [Bradyrhizobium sp. S69]